MDLSFLGLYALWYRVHWFPTNGQTLPIVLNGVHVFGKIKTEFFLVEMMGDCIAAEVT